MLGRDRAEAIKAAEDLNKRLDAWRKGQSNLGQPATPETFKWVADQYAKSARFAKLSPNTQEYYLIGIKQCCEYIGDMKVRGIKRAYGLKMYHDNCEESLKRASHMVAMARLIMNYARDLGLIDINPFTEMNLPKLPPRQTIWTMEQLEAAKKGAYEAGFPSIALAFQLLYDTAQRPGDVRLLAWTRYDGKSITLRQTKTGENISVPVTNSSKELLDKWDRVGITILIDENTGKAYSKDELSRKARLAMDKAGLTKELQLRDLRRSAIVRLGELNMPPQWIAAVSGHSIKSVSEILRIYLPVNSKMAAQAIQMLEESREDRK